MNKQLLFWFLGLAGIHLVQAQKPNVLFVISDDLNYAVSGLGHPSARPPILTILPSLELASQRAYCQFPFCGPSRASIMTGQYPTVNGVMSNGGKVDPERITLPRYFANHGYWSARVSKIYHMGDPSGYRTRNIRTRPCCVLGRGSQYPSDGNHDTRQTGQLYPARSGKHYPMKE